MQRWCTSGWWPTSTGGAMKTPEMETVQRLVNNWVGISKDKRASDLIESAVQRWGRDNLLDWPTKIGLVVQKTDASSLVYVLEWLYTDMRRQNKPDPYGIIDLKRVIGEILWTRTYVRAIAKKVP